MAATILLVEDDPILRDTLREAIELAGHAVIPAPNGRVALEVRTQAQVDLIITDLTMPEVDGPTLVKKLREAGDPTPVIVTSAVPIPGELRLAALFIHKPFDFDPLFALTRRVIQPRTSRLDGANLTIVQSQRRQFEAIEVLRLNHGLSFRYHLGTTRRCEHRPLQYWH